MPIPKYDPRPLHCIIRHSDGFFSCCSVKLTKLIYFIFKRQLTPLTVNGYEQFKLYKYDQRKDVTFDFFKHYSLYSELGDNIPFVIPIKNENDKNMYLNPMDIWKIKYAHFNFKLLNPVIEKYFTPSDKILENVLFIVDKYKIDYDKCIGVYYRGTDKFKEAKVPSFDTYYNKINEILSSKKHTQILIQTDSEPFLNFLKSKKIQNMIIIKENKTSKSKQGIHKTKSGKDNYKDMVNLFSTFLIISRCKNIIYNSSNCSLWISLYRKNVNNTSQFTHTGKWVDTFI